MQYYRRPDIISRGFVYVRESEGLMDDAKEVVKRVLEECEERNMTDWSSIKLSIRESLRDFYMNVPNVTNDSAGYHGNLMSGVYHS